MELQAPCAIWNDIGGDRVICSSLAPSFVSRPVLSFPLKRSVPGSTKGLLAYAHYVLREVMGSFTSFFWRFWTA